jgi:hypothetical protein
MHGGREFDTLDGKLTFLCLGGLEISPPFSGMAKLGKYRRNEQDKR